MRQRAQIRRDRGRRGRSLPALRDDDGMGHRGRAGNPRSRRRPGRRSHRRAAFLRQARPQKRRLCRLGPPLKQFRADLPLVRTPRNCLRRLASAAEQAEAGESGAEERQAGGLRDCRRLQRGRERE